MNHAAGVFHQQSRPDRDSYITINYDNVGLGQSYHFVKGYSNTSYSSTSYSNTSYSNTSYSNTSYSNTSYSNTSYSNTS